MARGGRGRDARLARQHAGRQCAAVAEREQHPRAGRFGEHRAEGRDVGVAVRGLGDRGHVSTVAPERFGPGRSVSTPGWRGWPTNASSPPPSCCYAALGAILRVLPGHLSGLGATPFAIGLAVGAPALTGLVARPTGGRLADRIGPRKVLPVGAAIMAVGVAPAVIDETSAQIASRLIVGIGEGAMMAAAVLWLLRLAARPDEAARSGTSASPTMAVWRSARCSPISPGVRIRPAARRGAAAARGGGDAEARPSAQAQAQDRDGEGLPPPR